MKIHRSIVAFTQQGLEKLNDSITKNFFQSTSHCGDALRELVNKQNRLEYLSNRGAKKPNMFESSAPTATLLAIIEFHAAVHCTIHSVP